MANSEAGSAYVSIIPSMKGFQSGVAAKVGAAMGVASSIADKAFGAIAGSMDKAIGRTDTMNNFPKVMQNLGHGAEEAQASISAMAEHITGLPATLDSISSTTQRLTASFGDLGKATEVGLALNDMILAGGAGTEAASSAMEQFTQMLSAGKVDMQAWKSVVTAAPGQMDQLAKSMLGANATSSDLYDALRDGRVSMEDLEAAVVQLDKNGGEGFASFETQARDATGGIGTAISNVPNRIAAAMQKVINAIGAPEIASAINGFSSGFSGIADLAVGAIDAVRDALSRLDLSRISGAISGVMDAVVGLPAALEPIGGAGEAIVGVVQGAIDGLADLIGAIMGHSSEIAATAAGILAVAGAIKAVSIATTVATGVSTLAKSLETVRAAMGMVKSVQGLGALLSTLAGGPLMLIVPAIVAAGAALAWFFTQTDEGKVALDNILNAMQPVIDVAQAVLPPILEALGGVVTSSLSAAAGVVANVFTAAFTVAGAVIGGAMTAIQGVVTAVVGVIQAMVGVFVGVFTGDWQMAADGASSVMDGLSAVLAGIMNAISGTIGGILNGIAGTFSSVWNGIAGTVSSVMGGLSQAIEGAMSGAKSTVSGALSAISGFFSGLRLELPHISLPHFSINGSFSLDPPSVPHLDVSWYGAGGLFTSASLIGVGERGTELAWPSYGPYLDKYGAAIADHMDAGRGVDEARLAGLLVSAFARAGLTIQVDGRPFGKLVRAHE